MLGQDQSGFSFKIMLLLTTLPNLLSVKVEKAI